MKKITMTYWVLAMVLAFSGFEAQARPAEAKSTSGKKAAAEYMKHGKKSKTHKKTASVSQKNQKQKRAVASAKKSKKHKATPKKAKKSKKPRHH